MSKCRYSSLRIIIGVFTAKPLANKIAAVRSVLGRRQAPPALEIDGVGEDENGASTELIKDLRNFCMGLVFDPSVDRIHGIVGISAEIWALDARVIIFAVHFQKTGFIGKPDWNHKALAISI